jgi:hypothetical protein
VSAGKLPPAALPQSAVQAEAVPAEASSPAPGLAAQVLLRSLPALAGPLRAPAVVAVDSLASLLLCFGLPGDLSDQSAAAALP